MERRDCVKAGPCAVQHPQRAIYWRAMQGHRNFHAGKKNSRVSPRGCCISSWSADQNFWLQVIPIVRGCEARIYGSAPQVPGVHSA